MHHVYAIGDVQGCFDQLCLLLEAISYNPQVDELWFVGDLVNRGPKSLEVLRYIKNLPRVKVVLGNHDLHLLALYYGERSQSPHTLQDILNAHDSDTLITWLQNVPLLHYDPALDFVMVHAGLPPQWDLQKAQSCASELEHALQQNPVTLMQHLYGDQPDQWHDDLQGWERLRFITNAFTRLRFCNAQGKLELKTQGKIGTQAPELMPWFQVPNRRSANERIVFGHWAALEGETHTKNVFSVDTGCVWGKSLTALRLNDLKKFTVACVLK